MANPTISQRIDFDASLNLDAASQRRFERQLGGGFFKQLEQAAKKAGSLLAAPMRAAGRAAANVPRVKVNTGIGDAAKKAAAATTKKSDSKRTPTTTGNAGKGGGAPSQAVVGAMKEFRKSAQQITKLVGTALRATMQQIQKITQAVTRMISLTRGGPRDPNDSAVKAENKAQAEAARDPVGGTDKPAHVIVDGGQVKVTNPPPPPEPPKPPPPPPDPRYDEPEERTVIDFDPTKILKMFMDISNRIFNIVKTVTAGAVAYTKDYAGPDGFKAAVVLADKLGITTEEAASKLNEALNAGVESTDNMYENINDVAQVSEYLGISISELVTNSRKLIRNNKSNFNLAAAAAGLADEGLLTIQEAYSVVTAAAASIGKSGVSVGSMVGRVQKMVGAFGDEIGPAMAQMQEIFRGQTIGDTIKEIMLMGTDNAEEVLRKARESLGDDAYSADTRKMIDKALASNDLVAMAEALQLVGPAAEDLAQTFRGQKLGVGFQSGGLAQTAYRQVFGMGAQSVQDIRVKRAAGVLGVEGGVKTGDTTGDVKTAREAALSITEILQKNLDEALTGPLGTAAYGFKAAVLLVTDAMSELISVVKSIGVYMAASLNPFGGDPAKAALEASPTSPVVRRLFAPPVKDFVYQGGKGITAIDTQDQFFGAKPGGAIDRAIASTASGMSRTMTTAGGRGPAGVTNVTVNVNGGDLGKVYEVVRNVLQQSGVRPPAGAYAT
jgi:hypothetical protein